jgi:hypothetical protein
MRIIGFLAVLLMFGGAAAMGYGKYGLSIDSPDQWPLMFAGGQAIGIGFIFGLIYEFLRFFDRRLPGRVSPATRPRPTHGDDTWPDIR